MALASLSRISFDKTNRTKSDSLLQQADGINKTINNKELAAYILYVRAINAELKNRLSGLQEAAEALSTTNNKRLLANCYYSMVLFYKQYLSDYPKAMEYCMKGLEASEASNDLASLINSWEALGGLYALLGDYENALMYLNKASDANKEYGDAGMEANLQSNMGECCYRLSGKYSEAIHAYTEALKLDKSLYNISIDESNLADVYARLNNLPNAFHYAYSALGKIYEFGRNDNVSWIFNILSRSYLKKQMPDSALYYGHLGLDTARLQGIIEFMRDNSLALANAYAYKKNFEQAYDYQIQYMNYRDSMLSGEVKNKVAVFKYESDLQKKQGQIASLNQQKKSQPKLFDRFPYWAF